LWISCGRALQQRAAAELPLPNPEDPERVLQHEDQWGSGVLVELFKRVDLLHHGARRQEAVEKGQDADAVLVHRAVAAEQRLARDVRDLERHVGCSFPAVFLSWPTLASGGAVPEPPAPAARRPRRAQRARRLGACARSPCLCRTVY
jgi:hypothetical protein